MRFPLNHASAGIRRNHKLLDCIKDESRSFVGSLRGPLRGPLQGQVAFLQGHCRVVYRVLCRVIAGFFAGGIAKSEVAGRRGRGGGKPPPGTGVEVSK